ncbi:hypothetical protein RF11_05458 [Thelohanellus kitauei]|uniref:Uncharacterized protein n=1 Tax=Thelohanellus kitauei TaxID=669202 RepID=A0A0C2IS09_THEKT|nr:hypothetical protein RF11_05458 [Thelohanellus kitauei]
MLDISDIDRKSERIQKMVSYSGVRHIADAAYIEKNRVEVDRFPEGLTAIRNTLNVCDHNQQVQCMENSLLCAVSKGMKGDNLNRYFPREYRCRAGEAKLYNGKIRMATSHPAMNRDSKRVKFTEKSPL